MTSRKAFEDSRRARDARSPWAAAVLMAALPLGLGAFSDAVAQTTPADGTAPGAVFRVNPEGRITKDGQVFPVQCAAWFGLEGRHELANDQTNPSGAPMELFLGNTFYANGGSGTNRTLDQTMQEIKGLGINMIRLPLVPQTLDADDPQGKDPNLKNHPSVRRNNARQQLEEFIVAADKNNIEVLLDIHSCSNFVGFRKGRLDARPPWVDANRDNYEFKREDSSCAATGNPASVTRIQAYDEAKWLDNLRELAGLGKQLGTDNIIGIDIFNEPFDYTWKEWKGMIERAFTAINEVNPNTLVFAEGLANKAGMQDGTPQTTVAVPDGNPLTNPNWGENLFEAGDDPPAIPKERLVFSPHTYGPSVFVQKQFIDQTQPGCAGLDGDAAGDARCNVTIDPQLLQTGWEEHFGYLKAKGFAVVVGEFGGNFDWPKGNTAIRDQNRFGYIQPGTDGQWQNAFVDYMVAQGIEGCLWAINPESGDTAGLYMTPFDPVSNTGDFGEWGVMDPRKVTLLKRLWARGQ